MRGHFFSPHVGDRQKQWMMCYSLEGATVVLRLL